jgi:NAD(P)-dependent dehydrogenase (short-subunit alcohol dehydrogenase family)
LYHYLGPQNQEVQVKTDHDMEKRKNVMQRQTAIVGGSSGIGQALLQALDADGHSLWNLSRRPPSGPPNVRHLPWDATEGEPDGDLPERLDGLVYCPGNIRLQPFARTSDEEFRQDFELNCLGAVRALRSLLPALRKSPAASVVLMSTVAVQTGMPFHASIAAAKGAVEGLTRSLAAELAPRIRVNAVAPSLTDTPLAGALLGSEDKRKQAATRHPLGRVGSAGEIAGCIRFLLAPEAGWISGQVLAIDGGLASLRLFK